MPARVFRTGMLAALAAGYLAMAPAANAQLNGRADAAAQAKLNQAWSSFQTRLDEARQSLTDPKYSAPPATERNLADGYRYLLGHLARSIEWETAQNPDFPYFERAVDMLTKWTIDNPDTMYLFARIDGGRYYRISGKPQAGSQWQGKGPAAPGAKTPRTVVFQTSTFQVGDTGGLGELTGCRNISLDNVDQFRLNREADGSFQILVGPSRPEGYQGNFLKTKATLPCTDTKGAVSDVAHVATEIDAREVFYDWDNEAPLDLAIVSVGGESAHRPVRTAQELSADLTAIGKKVRNQIRFWSLLQDERLGIIGDRKGKPFLPLNDINQPAAPPASAAGGTAGAGQIYASGVFDLRPDEALLVKASFPAEPYYVGLQLSNVWGESLDQATYASSRNLFQSDRNSDGSVYYVISNRDPGVRNWLDTTGIPKGSLGFRFVFDHAPAPAELPHLEAKKVRFDSIRKTLPADVKPFSPESRDAEIARRAAHIQRRWRQY